MRLKLQKIKIDGGTQARARLDDAVVAEYAEAIRAGAEMPAVVVFHDGASHWLADGFHRFFAHKQAGQASILADVRTGTQRDAILFSVAANAHHGLRRSNADKRKAILTLLADPEWSRWSDSEIARQCAVSDKTVAAQRREISESHLRNSEDSHLRKSPDTKRKVERNGKVYEQETKAIGKQKDDGADEYLVHHDLREAREQVTELADLLASYTVVVTGGEQAIAKEMAKLRGQLRVVESQRDVAMEKANQLVKEVKALRRQLEKRS